MKTLIRMIKQTLLLVMLSASLVTAQAQERGERSGTLKRFETAAIVDQVNSVELIANGQQYRFDPELKVLEGSLKGSIKLLQVGDSVWLQGTILNGVKYIRTISVLPSDSDA